MDEKIENELLNTNTLNEFRKIVFKYGISTTDKLSKKALEHYNKLGCKQSAEQHNDPRRK